MTNRNGKLTSGTETTRATVFIVDDDPQVRTSIEQLAHSVGLDVAAFESAREFLSGCDPSRPGCLVIDVRMPGMSGLELQQELHNTEITLPVIVMTGYAEVPMAVQAFKDGAFDFVQKPYSPQSLLDVIQRAIEMDTTQRAHAAQLREIDSRIEALSPRENEVMQWLVNAKTTKEIAAALDISLTTVDFHRNNILKKMNADNVVDLTRQVKFLELADPRGK